MSRSLNRTQIIGNLGADPDVHVSPQGQPRTQFSVAVNERWKGSDNQVQEHTEWFRVVCFGALAEITGEHLQKGSRVLVEGRMRMQRWQDGNGQERTSVELHADDIIFLDSRHPEHHTSNVDKVLEP